MRVYLKENSAIGLGVLFLLSHAGKADAAGSFKTKSLNCESLNKSVVVFTECKIHFKQRRSVVSLNITFNSFVDNGKVHLKIMQKQATGGWRPFYYDKTVDTCEFLRNPKKDIFLAAIVNYAKRYLNFQQCPYKAGDYIRIANLEFDDDFMKIFPLDIGEYGLFTYWQTDNKLIAYVNGSIVFSDYSRIV